MNKVYYWEPKLSNGNVGHSALDISFGQGAGRAEYVSWWPKDLSFFKPGGSWINGNYADDRDSEGGEATAAVELRCLDEDKMRAEWNAAKHTEGYAFYTKNCASMVHRILIAGGATLSNQVSKFNATMPVIATPWNVIGLAHVIAANADAIVKQRKAGWVQEKPGWFDDWGFSGPGVGGDGLTR